MPVRGACDRPRAALKLAAGGLPDGARLGVRGGGVSSPAAEPVVQGGVDNIHGRTTRLRPPTGETPAR